MNRVQRALLIQRRVRLHIALERGLAIDAINLFRNVARRAAQLAGQGQFVRAEAAAVALADPLGNAILRRGTGVARTFIGYTFEELARAQKDASPANVALTATQDWLRKHALDRASAITNTTREIIRTTIAKGDADGIGTAAIARSIRSQLGGASAVGRANTIARTETHTAANVGSNEAAEVTGLELDKEWGATEDERTRPSHADADGQRVAMDESFKVGGSTLEFPGDPDGPPEEIINCRCVTLYRPRE